MWTPNTQISFKRSRIAPFSSKFCVGLLGSHVLQVRVANSSYNCSKMGMLYLQDPHGLTLTLHMSSCSSENASIAGFHQGVKYVLALQELLGCSFEDLAKVAQGQPSRVQRMSSVHPQMYHEIYSGIHFLQP